MLRIEYDIAVNNIINIFEVDVLTQDSIDKIKKILVRYYTRGYSDGYMAKKTEEDNNNPMILLPFVQPTEEIKKGVIKCQQDIPQD